MPTRDALHVHATLSATVIAIGAVLMAGKIYADSEPGLIPLVLVVSGIVWRTITAVRRRRLRAQR